MLGADWSRGPWAAGLMLSHARGEGGYRGADRGTVESTLTGLYPYGRHAVNDRVTVWGVAGYGAGTLTLTPDGQDAIRTDIDLTMAAVGLRGVLVKAPATGGVELAAKTDALGVRTTSAAVSGGADGSGNLAAAEADVTRLRLGLEGTWRGLNLGSGELTPRLEAGLRHDGGDAETGFGLDLGGGLAWSDRTSGLSAEVSGRGLLTHEAGGFRDRGFAGALTWDPRPDSDRGVRLTMRQTVGVSATGGMDALLGRDTLAGLAANDNGDELQRRRMEMKPRLRPLRLRRPVHLHAGTRRRPVRRRARLQPRLAARARAARPHVAGAEARSHTARERQRQRARAQHRVPHRRALVRAGNAAMSGAGDRVEGTVEGAHAWAFMRRRPEYRKAWQAHAVTPRFEAGQFRVRVQDEADLAAVEWRLLAWEDPEAQVWRSPFLSGIPMLVGEPDPDPYPDPAALLPLLAAAGAKVEGLRLVDGPLVVKVELGEAVVQILIPSGRIFDPGDGIMVKLGLSLPLEMIITRIEELWTVTGGQPPRKGRVRGANSRSC